MTCRRPSPRPRLASPPPAAQPAQGRWHGLCSPRRPDNRIRAPASSSTCLLAVPVPVPVRPRLPASPPPAPRASATSCRPRPRRALCSSLPGQPGPYPGLLLAVPVPVVPRAPAAQGQLLYLPSRRTGQLQPPRLLPHHPLQWCCCWASRPLPSGSLVRCPPPQDPNRIWSRTSNSLQPPAQILSFSLGLDL